jgi:hypothetical protein
MKKFLSRKFLLTLIGDIMGFVTMLIGENAVATIVGATAVIVINACYCIVEGNIDAKSIGQITDAVEDIAEVYGADEKTVDAINKIDFAVEEIVEDGGDSTVEGE